MSIVRWTLMVGLSVGCTAKVSVQLAPAAGGAAASAPAPASVTAPMIITDRAPTVVGPGTLVTLSGQNFRPGMTVAMTTGRTLALKVASDSRASFVVPADLPEGGFELAAQQDSANQKISLIFASKTDFPFVTAAAATVCDDQKFYDSSGTLQSGSRACAAAAGAAPPANCKADGQTDCVTTAAFPAVMAAGLAAKVVSGQTVAGVSGNVTLPLAGNVRVVNGPFGVAGSGSTPTLTDCTTDGALGCVTGPAYPAALVSLATLDPSNVKRGVVIGGVTGAFPSASHPLPQYVDSGATPTVQAPDVVTTSLTNFITQLTTAGAFQFWDATGVRRTGSGDANIVNANVAAGITFANLSIAGTAASPNAWDLRAGVTVNAVTGKLLTNCRNGGSTATFDTTMPQNVTAINTATSVLTVPNHGLTTNQSVQVSYFATPTGLLSSTTYYVIVTNANSLQLSASSGPGAPVAISAAGSNVTIFGWNNGTLNTSDTIDDSNAGGALLTMSPWAPDNFCGGIEVAPGDSNVWKDVTTGTCAAFPANCRFQDKISDLTWTNVQNGGGWLSWQQAMSYCHTLTFDGLTGWRLPTQKEFMDAYAHGIRSAASPSWIPLAQMGNRAYWSATTFTYDPTRGWYIFLNDGEAGVDFKTSMNLVTCVR